ATTDVVEVGEPVSLRATVVNEGSTATSVPVRLQLFGEVVNVERVQVPADGSTSVEFEHTIVHPGAYEARAGTESVRLFVDGTPTPGPSTPEADTGVETPGFGVGPTVLALVVAVIVARRATRQP
ncbi:MAG: hypothetical protein ACQETI_12320, partial [Halobacteriota archaeon]